MALLPVVLLFGLSLVQVVVNATLAPDIDYLEDLDTYSGIFPSDGTRCFRAVSFSTDSPLEVQVECLQVSPRIFSPSPYSYQDCSEGPERCPSTLSYDTEGANTPRPRFMTPSIGPGDFHGDDHHSDYTTSPRSTFRYMQYNVNSSRSLIGLGIAEVEEQGEQESPCVSPTTSEIQLWMRDLLITLTTSEALFLNQITALIPNVLAGLRSEAPNVEMVDDIIAREIKYVFTYLFDPVKGMAIQLPRIAFLLAHRILSNFVGSSILNSTDLALSSSLIPYLRLITGPANHWLWHQIVQIEFPSGHVSTSSLIKDSFSNLHPSYADRFLIFSWLQLLYEAKLLSGILENLPLGAGLLTGIYEFNPLLHRQLFGALLASVFMEADIPSHTYPLPYHYDPEFFTKLLEPRDPSICFLRSIGPSCHSSEDLAARKVLLVAKLPRLDLDFFLQALSLPHPDAAYNDDKMTEALLAEFKACAPVDEDDYDEYPSFWEFDDSSDFHIQSSVPVDTDAKVHHTGNSSVKDSSDDTSFDNEFLRFAAGLRFGRIAREGLNVNEAFRQLSDHFTSPDHSNFTSLGARADFLFICAVLGFRLQANSSSRLSSQQSSILFRIIMFCPDPKSFGRSIHPLVGTLILAHEQALAQFLDEKLIKDLDDCIYGICNLIWGLIVNVPAVMPLQRLRLGKGTDSLLANFRWKLITNCEDRECLLVILNALLLADPVSNVLCNHIDWFNCLNADTVVALIRSRLMNCNAVDDMQSSFDLTDKLDEFEVVCRIASVMEDLLPAIIHIWLTSHLACSINALRKLSPCLKCFFRNYYPVDHNIIPESATMCVPSDPFSKSWLVDASLYYAIISRLAHISAEDKVVNADMMNIIKCSFTDGWNWTPKQLDNVPFSVLKPILEWIVVSAPNLGNSDTEASVDDPRNVLDTSFITFMSEGLKNNDINSYPILPCIFKALADLNDLETCHKSFDIPLFNVMAYWRSQYPEHFEQHATIELKTKFRNMC